MRAWSTRISRLNAQDPPTYLPSQVRTCTHHVYWKAGHSLPVAYGVWGSCWYDLQPSTTHMQVLVVHVIDDGWTVRVRLARDMIALTVPRDRQVERTRARRTTNWSLTLELVIVCSQCRSCCPVRNTPDVAIRKSSHRGAMSNL